MEYSNLRLVVAVSASSKKTQEEVNDWFSQKKSEMFRTGLFENIVRKTVGERNHASVYAFVLKNDQSLFDFKENHFTRLVTDFQKIFPKNKVDMIPVLGEMEIQ